VEYVNPYLPPAAPWTGAYLHKHFCSLKTKFALVDEILMLGYTLISQPIDGHIKILIPNDTPNMISLSEPVAI
jgi:hypothetical protein